MVNAWGFDVGEATFVAVCRGMWVHWRCSFTNTFKQHVWCRGSRLCQLLHGLKQDCGHVSLTEAFYHHPRYYTTRLNLEHYNNKIHLLSESLKNFTPPVGCTIMFWNHANVTNSGSVTSTWSPDGLHLSGKGVGCYSRSVRGALKHTLNFIR